MAAGRYRGHPAALAAPPIQLDPVTAAFWWDSSLWQHTSCDTARQSAATSTGSCLLSVQTRPAAPPHSSTAAPAPGRRLSGTLQSETCHRCSPCRRIA
eukprot:scaffold106635_cov68-Phaeocystis_antarctica.AAC.2